MARLLDKIGYLELAKREDFQGRTTPAYPIRLVLISTQKVHLTTLNAYLPTSKRIHVQPRGPHSLPHYRLRLFEREAVTLLHAVRPYVRRQRREIDVLLALDALRRELSPPKFHQMPPEWETGADALLQTFRLGRVARKEEVPMSK